MKTTKIALIATIATIIIIALCGVAMAETYTLTAVVTAVEKVADDLSLWNVTVTDENGNLWDFIADEEEETFKICDLVVLTMADMGGEHDEADEVVDVEYVNTLTPTETAEWLIG